MAYLRSLAPDAVLLDLFKAFPEAAKPLLDYHEVLLRGPSPLSIGQRELIAAYVSALNACDYCHGVHEATAGHFGVAPSVLAELMHDVSTAQVEDQMRPLLHCVRKLTLTPAKLTPQDVEAMYAAGWDDRALHDAVSVCALFNLMNRLVSGLGIEAGVEYFEVASERLARMGYLGLRRILDEPKPDQS